LELLHRAAGLQPVRYVSLLGKSPQAADADFGGGPVQALGHRQGVALAGLVVVRQDHHAGGLEDFGEGFPLLAGIREP